MAHSKFNLQFDFSQPLNFSDPKPGKAFGDLPITASYLAYENESFIRNVVVDRWQRNFVKFFNCLNDTQAFIFTDAPTNAKLIVLAFRGTEITSIEDFLTDFKFKQVLIQNRLQPRQKVGSVHQGFLEALIHVPSDPYIFPPGNKDEGQQWAYHDIQKKLSSLVKKHPDAKILVTGHSLGGALAVLFSLLLHMERKDMVDYAKYKLITFGQPRVGNDAFAQYMDKVVQLNYCRVVFAHDLVARIPLDLPPFSNFKHFGICMYYKNWTEEEMVREVPIGMSYFKKLSDIISDRTAQRSTGHLEKGNWKNLLDMVKIFFAPSLVYHDRAEYLRRVKSSGGNGGSFRA